MATSNSTDFTLTATQIVREAMDVLEVLGVGRSPTNEEIQTGLRTLNMMVKAWQTDGLHLWLHTEAVLFLVDGQASYSLPGANVAKASDLTETTLDGDVSSAATMITVASASGIADGETIGIVQDDGTIHWTTVNGAPVGEVVTLTDALTDDASDGAAVYAYSTTISRPNRITDARRRNAGQDTPIRLISRQEYFGLPNKSNEGTPTQAYYDPQTGTGVLYVWPAPSSVNDQIRFTYSRPLQDFDSVTDNADFPSEWMEAIVYNLAFRLAPKYGRRPAPEVVAMATNSYIQLRGWDREMEPIQFQPEFM